VLALAQDLEIRIIDSAMGELLCEFTPTQPSATEEPDA